jgi:predicted lipoprotein
MRKSLQKELLAWGGMIAGAAIVCWVVPPFHIVNLKVSREQTAAVAFNAETFVERLWNGPMKEAAEHAVDARELISAIQQDPKAAHEKYGRSGGLGSSYFYFVRGEGRVVAVDKDRLSLALVPNAARADVVLTTGNIFGNAIRDGTGVVNISDFPDSQNFNAVSSEINRRIEDLVLPAVRKEAKVGMTVRFAGCAEIVDESTDLHPLQVVPLSVELR